MLTRRKLLRGTLGAGLLAPFAGCDLSWRQEAANQGTLQALAVEKADRAALEAALERIRIWLEANNPVVANKLLPGLTEEEIEELTADLPFRLPQEVLWLYQWRGGVDLLAGDFMWYHRWMTLEAAIDEYRSLRRTVYMGWKRSWFPLFETQEEYYFVKCGATAVEAAPVYFFFNEDPEVSVAYINLRTLAETVAACYERGVVEVVDAAEGFTEGDAAAIARVHREFNPGVEFPYGY